MSNMSSARRVRVDDDDSDRPAPTPRRILAVASHRGKGAIPWRNGRDDGELQERGGKAHLRKVQQAAIRRFDAEELDEHVDRTAHGLHWRRVLADALHGDGFVCGWSDVDVVEWFGYDPQDLPADLAAEFYQGLRAGEGLQGANLPDSVRAMLRGIGGER